MWKGILEKEIEESLKSLRVQTENVGNLNRILFNHEKGIQNLKNETIQTQSTITEECQEVKEEKQPLT